MMRDRKYDAAFVQEQITYRRLLFDSLDSFAISDLKNSLKYKEAVIASVNKLVQTCGRTEKSFFVALEHITIAIYQLMEYFEKAYSASPDAIPFKTAAGLRLKLANQELPKCDPTRPSVHALVDLTAKLAVNDDITLFETCVSDFKKKVLPFIYSAVTRDFARNDEKSSSGSSDPGDEPPMISVLLYFDQELWANPQVIKPKHLYSISGNVKVNSWPEGYSQLNLLPVSTTNDSWYKLSLPSVPYSDRLEFPIDGHITIDTPQNWLDPPIAIRLYAYYSREGWPQVPPAVIGYDQLILKVIDTNSFPFPTGYDSLNQKAFEIASQILNEMSDIERVELDNFLILLSGILNYQGYCYQHGIYKGRSTTKEADFRDALIAYLSARSNLSEVVTKEGALAGGRVEINFRGIVAELKVEKTISDREKVMQAHEQQAAAYAAATGSRLSILCILDLTPKKYAPAPAHRNVYLRKPPLHGFEAGDSPSRVVVVFIDGNLPSPSGYS